MTSAPPPASPSDEGSAATPSSGDGSPPETGGSGFTRASAVWVATGASLFLLILLIVFVLQNSAEIEVRFLGLTGAIPLGMALLIAAVGGGVVVAIAGMARIIQLRLTARRAKRVAGRD